MEYMTIILTSSVIGVLVSGAFGFIQFLITRHDNKQAQGNASCIAMQLKHEENFKKILDRGLRPYRDELCISTKAGYEMWPGPYGDRNGSRK